MADQFTINSTINLIELLVFDDTIQNVFSSFLYKAAAASEFESLPVAFHLLLQ